MSLALLNGIDNYRKLFMDAEFWQPYVFAALGKEGLPCKKVRGGIAGTYPTFIVDDRYVIKFFGRLFNGEKTFEAELHASQLVKPVHEIPVPALVTQGRLYDDGSDWSWPYLVFEYLDGISIGEAWDQLSTGSKLEIASEMGQTVRCLHSVPLGDDRHFKSNWDEFRKFLELQKINCAIRIKNAGSLPVHLLGQIDSYLLPIDRLVETDHNPHLIHSDLTRDHLLGRICNGRWKPSGWIDFGDSMVGNIYYELIALHLDLFRCDKHLLEIFLKSYDLEQSLRSDFAVRAMNMTLLHQFSEYILPDLFNGFPKLRQVNSLKELADELWEVGK